MNYLEIAAHSNSIIESVCLILGLGDWDKEDESGHGTHVTLLILKTAPMADVYVACVFASNIEVTPKYVADGILYAVNDWEADIILMSFGFKVWILSISQAIKVASFKNVLMFVAASNNGVNSDINLVYLVQESSIFNICATDRVGNRYRYNPLWDPCSPWNFATLGENVLSAWTGNQMLAKSGTSMAAIVAAGTAVLLLNFSRLLALNNQQIRHVKYIALFEGIRLLLEALSS